MESWLRAVGGGLAILLVYRSLRAAPGEPLASHPSVRREIHKKARLRAAASARGSGSAVRGSSAGLPEGQTAAKKWIVLDLGLRPPPGAFTLDPAGWKLRIALPGAAGAAELTMADVSALGVRQYADHQWHCVTGWSALGLVFDGVPLARLLEHEKVRSAAGGMPVPWSWLVQRSADGYSAPVCRTDATDAFLALAVDGQPLSMEHGGPRLVLPALFGWKSAKWMVELELLGSYRPGFWERLGCHPRGRVRLNERFREGWSAAVWAWLAAAPGFYRRLGGYDLWIFVMQAGGSALGAAVRVLRLGSAPRARAVSASQPAGAR